MPIIDHIINNSKLRFSIIFGLIFLAYSNIFFNQFVMDDFDYVANWPLIQDWKNWPQFFIGFEPHPRQPGIYSPLKTLIHSIHYHLFGLNPLGHHIVSLLIHFVGVWLVYQIVFLLSKTHSMAFWAALLFGIHPVHAEAVTYITASIDSLGIIFLFASFYFYIRDAEAKHFLSRYYFYSLIFAAAAIFTHELNLALPVLFFWHEVCLNPKRISLGAILKKIWPLFLLVGLYILAKYAALKSLSRGGYIEDSLYLTMLIMVKAWAKYVLICFFPLTLTHNHIISRGIYSFDFKDFDRAAVLSQSFFDPDVVLALALLGVLAWVAFYYFRRKPLISFCVGWFFISLLPASQIIPSGVFFAERYLYLATFGFCFLLGIGVDVLWKKKNYRPAVMWGIILVVFFCVGRTWMRNRDWRDEIVFFEAAVRSNPQSALLRSDRGIVYDKNNLSQKAVESFKESLAIRSDDPSTYFAMANVYSNLRQFTKSIEALKQALALDPEFAEAYFNLAMVYARWGLLVESNSALNRAVYYYKKQGRYDEARKADQAYSDYVQSQKKVWENAPPDSGQ